MYVRNRLIARDLIVLKPRTDTLAKYTYREIAVLIPVARDREIIASRVTVSKRISWRDQGISIAQEKLASTGPVETNSIRPAIVPVTGNRQILIISIWKLIVTAASFVAVAEVE